MMIRLITSFAILTFSCCRLYSLTPIAVSACVAATSGFEELEDCERCVGMADIGLEGCLYNAMHNDRSIVVSGDNIGHS
jgi:hypothetical protein